MNYNPCAHIQDRKIRKVNRGYEYCSCGWLGVSFAMHLVAMEITDDVLNVIEEED